MNIDIINTLRAKLDVLQNQTLSGGIVARNLHISDNGSGELTLSGDITITLKVLDLTTNGAPKLSSLMTFTQQVITSKLRGGGYKGGISYFKYNAAKNKFDFHNNQTYSVRYNFNFNINVQQINMLSQLKRNDFVLAVVDSIGHQFTDQYGRRQASRGLTKGQSWPAIVSYNGWIKDKNIGVHEFFHTLGLDDIEDNSKKNRLMYHLGNNTGYSISDLERGDLMEYILGDINNILKKNYSNANIETDSRLKTFLNNPTNGFKYNKAKFR